MVIANFWVAGISGLRDELEVDLICRWDAPRNFVKIFTKSLLAALRNGSFAETIMEKGFEMSRISARLLVGLVFGGTSLGVVGGDIAGKITLKGTPPEEIVVKREVWEPTCSQARKPGEKLTTRFYVTDAEGGLADVFVSLKSVTGKFKPPSKPAVLDQVGCEYMPHVLGVQAGQNILVKNSDPVFHNVRSTPRVEGNPMANKAQLPKGKDLVFVFHEPEKFLRFKCDVHPWMIAYVNVVAHPFFAISGKDGSYRIKNVPPGEYEIEAIHRKTHGPKYSGVSKKITVGPDGVVVDFVVDITK